MDTGQLPERGENKEISIVIKEDRNVYVSKDISIYETTEFVDLKT